MLASLWIVECQYNIVFRHAFSYQVGSYPVLGPVIFDPELAFTKPYVGGYVPDSLSVFPTHPEPNVVTSLLVHDKGGFDARHPLAFRKFYVIAKYPLYQIAIGD